VYCPPGTYGNTTGGTSVENACQPCPPGYYCSGTGNTLKTILPCPIGAYCPTSSDNFINCPGGTLSDKPLATNFSTCRDTPAGSYTLSGASSLDKFPCPAGYFCPVRTGAYLNFPCPEGTYSSVTSLVRADQCTNCTLGNYCPLASTVPSACPVGKYNKYEMGTSASICQLCEVRMNKIRFSLALNSKR
jgi:hypothetical protein